MSIYVNCYLAMPEEDGVLTQIVRAFRENDIIAGNESKGDLTIDLEGDNYGNPYIYTRTPNLATGHYMTTHDLELNGFSRLEAATIGDIALIKDNIRWPIENTEDQVECNINEFEYNQKYKNILKDGYIQNITEDRHGIDFLYASTLRTTAAKDIFNYNDIANSLAPIFINIPEEEKQDEEIWRILDRGINTELFDPFLEIASTITSALVEHMPAQSLIKEKSSLRRNGREIRTEVSTTGNIMPAIYHGLYKPLMMYCQDRGLLNRDLSADTLQEFIADTNFNQWAFIKNIVKCSLRKTHEDKDEDRETQINSWDLIYINDMSESYVDSMVEAAMQSLCPEYREYLETLNDNSKATSLITPFNVGGLGTVNKGGVL